MNVPFLPLDLDLRRHLRLWVGVLHLAIDDVRGIGAGSTKSDRALRMEQARTWVRSDNREVASFHWICVTLDIDPERARARILNEKTR
jgi:hypothetical protein